MSTTPCLLSFARGLAPFAVAALAAVPLAAQGGTAHYELTFTSTWSSQSHPIDFPSNAHYSQLCVASHTDQVEFWRVGGMATTGVQQIAETGRTGEFAREVAAAVRGGTARRLDVMGAMGTPTSRVFEFDVDAEFPLVTVLTMIAPSPDWFVGVNSLSMMQNGQWVDSMTVDLVAWDSGTDSGTSYRSANSPTVPAQPIGRVTTASGPFQGRPGPIGTFAFRRVSSTQVFGSGVNPAGSMTVAGRGGLGEMLDLGIHDPAGTVQTPSATAVVFSGTADPAFPGGRVIPGLGELLVGLPADGVAGPMWMGSPVSFRFTVPNDVGLMGARVFAQAALSDGSNTTLTDAAEIVLGRL